ncbi:hypothetical protein GcM3_181032 [Golovinomyces cichoracearum]|uniref:Uncharacterized protein n=1 Tax=Golovinomyces cichoracearum TaxID=62708 RepID=A0A420HMG3_9PEZI|nr:hypothetical protein GcM3_181032 [Golovinomyces cichoracearum]
MAGSISGDLGVAGMSLLYPSCLGLNKRINEMGETLDKVLADVQRDISNLKADTTGIKAEISGLNSNLNSLNSKVSNLDDNISRMMKSIEKLLHVPVSAQLSISQDDSLISSAKKEEALEPDTLEKRQTQGIQTSLSEKRHTGPERLPNGDINLQVPLRKPHGLTAQERKVVKDWPEAVLLSQSHLYGETNHKNKINFKHETKLSVANHTALQTLGDVQDQLKLALIPYHL